MEKEAVEEKSRAIVLEVLGDLPSADLTPPKNVLFVCKLNPVTSDEDLEIIFSKYGNVKDCKIVRDARTKKSLGYAFITYESEDDCNLAYTKMKDRTIIDDRKVLVDFSQSVSKLWNDFCDEKNKYSIENNNRKSCSSGKFGEKRKRNECANEVEKNKTPNKRRKEYYR